MVGLKPVRTPDALHVGEATATVSAMARPVQCVVAGRLGEREGDDPLFHRGAEPGDGLFRRHLSTRSGLCRA